MPAARTCPQCGADLPADAPEQPCPACLMQLGLASWTEYQGGDDAQATQSRSPRFVAPSVDELTEHFPQLEIIELVGQGGMGAVYKARQKSLDRLVALKIIKPDAAGDPSFAERFSREAKALARMSHPNLVTVHDFGQTGGLFFFVMEFVDGVNLRQAIEASRLTPREAIEIVPAICDALQYAHDEGIVHRDIKPENILLDQQGRVKIADFGLAKLLGDPSDDVTLTGTHQVMGTPRYMAPEQMVGTRAVDHRADIYSLGVVFYELLTGEVPMGCFDPPSQKVAVDVRLDEVVLRALARDPDRRYQQASAVRTDVESITQQPVSADTATASIGTSIDTDEETSGWAVARQSLLVLLSVVGVICLFMPWTLISVQHNHAAGTSGVNLPATGVQHWFPTVASLLSLGLLCVTLASIGLRRSPWRAILSTASGLALVTLALFTICVEPLTVHSASFSDIVTQMDEWSHHVTGGSSALAELVRLDEEGDRIEIHAEAFVGSWVALGVGLALLQLGQRELRSVIRESVGQAVDNPRVAVQAPADALRITGMLGIAALVLVFLLNMVDIWINGGGARGQSWSLLRTLLVVAFMTHLVHACFVSPWIVFGASRMKSLRSPGAARTASVLAMVPLSFAAFVGLPVGIWSLLTLGRMSETVGAALDH